MQPQQTVTQPVMKTSNHRGLPKWLKLVLAVVVTFLVAMGAVFIFLMQGTQAAEKVSNQFIEALQANKTSDAYVLTAQAFKDSTTEEQLGEIIARISPLLQGESKTIVGRKVAKSSAGVETAAIVYEITINSNTKRYVRVVMRNTSGGTWQVLNFRSSDTSLSAEIE